MTSPTGVHTLAPDDLAIIYNIAPLYQAGIDGTGQKVAVVGSTGLRASDFTDIAAFALNSICLRMFRRRFSTRNIPIPGST